MITLEKSTFILSALWFHMVTNKHVSLYSPKITNKMMKDNRTREETTVKLERPEKPTDQRKLKSKLKERSHNKLICTTRIPESIRTFLYLKTRVLGECEY